MNRSPANRDHARRPADTEGLGDEIPCAKCGSALDTGLECTECGYDMAPEIYATTQPAPGAELGKDQP